MIPGNSTMLEIRFLDGIVSGEWIARPPAAKIQAIRNYARVVMKRAWGDAEVDAKAVRDYALFLIEKMRACPTPKSA